jgi:hypothetical protein
MDESGSKELYYCYPNDLAIIRKVAQLLLDMLGCLAYIQGVLSLLPGNT